MSPEMVDDMHGRMGYSMYCRVDVIIGSECADHLDPASHEANKCWHGHTHLSCLLPGGHGVSLVRCTCFEPAGSLVLVACRAVACCPGQFPRQGARPPAPKLGLMHPWRWCAYNDLPLMGSCCCMRSTCGMTGTWPHWSHSGGLDAG